MAYITQTDIENVFGSSNVATWSNLDNDNTGVVAARITAAIAYAEGYVTNRFRGGIYALPFSPTTDVLVKDWCAKLAGIWLYTSRPNRGGDPSDDYAEMHDDVMRQMDRALAGSLQLSCARAYGSPTAPVVVLSDGARRVAQVGGSGQATWGG